MREVKSDAISSVWITNERSASSDELIGKVINSKYKIEMFLGQGGFGKVYKITDLNQKIA